MTFFWGTKCTILHHHHHHLINILAPPFLLLTSCKITVFVLQSKSLRFLFFPFFELLLKMWIGIPHTYYTGRCSLYIFTHGLVNISSGQWCSIHTASTIPAAAAASPSTADSSLSWLHQMKCLYVVKLPELSCPVLSTRFILRLSSYSAIRHRTRFINGKSQFILRITRAMLIRR